MSKYHSCVILVRTLQRKKDGNQTIQICMEFRHTQRNPNRSCKVQQSNADRTTCSNPMLTELRRLDSMLAKLLEPILSKTSYDFRNL